jgi:prepilin-type N-terminal cleavage/methylation domain-containing protein
MGPIRPFRNPSRLAFSLIELLITVAIILTWATAYYGPNNRNRQESLKRACEKNLEKIYVFNGDLR